MKTFLIKTLGCKVNSYESEVIRSSFINNGYVESDNDNADICIVNTCTVTNTSDNKSKKIINSYRKNNPNAIIIAVGCFCQFRKDEINNLIDADIILGNKDKSKIIDYLNDYILRKEKILRFYDMSSQEFEDMSVNHFNSHHRAFIKIEDGCNNFCSYCIIPFVRGRVRSKDYEKVINEVNSLVSNGHKEVVLSGIHTGQYNNDGKRLSDLINGLLVNTKIERIRLSSVEIVELDIDMINIIKNENRFVSHLHIPLQSGCDKILKLMNRRYDTNYFLDKVNELRSARENIALSTDVIVGFPGETEEDFIETYNFCKKIGFTKIHVFPYSDRSGTVASKMSNKIDNAIKKDRVRRLSLLSDELAEEYFKSFIDKNEKVLIEEYKDGYYYGFTSNYLYLKLKGNYKINEIYDVVVKMEMFVK